MKNMICNICGKVLRESISEAVDPFTCESFSIFTCTCCEAGHTLPCPENVAQYYGASYYGRRHGFTADFRAKQRARIICTLFPKREKLRLLDIGCGDGTFMEKAKQNGWVVSGTEINPDQVIYNKENVCVALEDVYDNAPYDCITLWHSIEHLNDPLETMDHVRNLLHKDGVLLIAVPNSGSVQAKLFGCHWFHFDVPRHLYHFNLKSLKTLLNKTGFVIKNKRYGEVEYDILGWSQSIMNSFLPHPNLFFKILSRKKTGFKKAVDSLIFFMGCVFSAFAIPMVLVERLSENSGTLIVVAKTRQEKCTEISH